MYKYLPKYAHACTQRTPIGLLDLIEAEFEKNATGIRGYDLEELYYEAKKDLEKLVSEGKIMMYRDRELTCDVFFPIFKQYLKDVPKSLKESWHRVPIPDPAKLKAELKDMGHLAAAPPPLPTVSRRKKKAQPVEKKQRKVRDEYNHHVDPALMNDDWRNTVSEKANIYGKN
jgi:hypothetical protein